MRQARLGVALSVTASLSTLGSTLMVTMAMNMSRKLLLNIDPKRPPENMNQQKITRMH